MNWLTDLLWCHGRFLGIEWNAWKIVGWLGNLIFFSRFLVQWYATEKQKRVVVPAAFWWLSLAGAALLFTYAAFYRRDSVFTFAYAFTWIPYVRNLVIHRRVKALMQQCTKCGTECEANANYCPNCGLRLTPC